MGYSAHVGASDSGFQVWILMRSCLGRSGLTPHSGRRRRMEGAEWVQRSRVQHQPASASPRGFDNRSPGRWWGSAADWCSPWLGHGCDMKQCDTFAHDVTLLQEYSWLSTGIFAELQPSIWGICSCRAHSSRFPRWCVQLIT